MAADQEARSPLETEPVQKLIVRYAIPTALTLSLIHISEPTRPY